MAGCRCLPTLRSFHVMLSTSNSEAGLSERAWYGGCLCAWSVGARWHLLVQADDSCPAGRTAVLSHPVALPSRRTTGETSSGGLVPDAAAMRLAWDHVDALIAVGSCDGRAAIAEEDCDPALEKLTHPVQSQGDMMSAELSWAHEARGR